MIHPLTKVQWIDVKSQQVFTDTIDKMFQMYSLKAKDNDNESEIILDSIVKVTDWYGWTDVVSIKRIECCIVWKHIYAATKSVVLSNNTTIPVYEDDSSYKGFHGETKYNHIIKSLCDIRSGDMIRIRRGIDDYGNEVEFANVELLQNKECIPTENYGYEIVTKSGFFNANNIHLFSRSAEPLQ